VDRSRGADVATAEFFAGTLAAPGRLTINRTAEGVTNTARVTIEL